MPLKKTTVATKKKLAEKQPGRSAIKGRTNVAKENVHTPRFVNFLSRDSEISLRRIVRSLMEPGKGILAADDSVNTIDQCLRTMKLSVTEANRVKYLDVLLGACKELCHFVSGVLLKEEMSRLKSYKGRSVAFLLQEVDILMGIRLDKNFLKLPGTFGEWATAGLDDLQEACKRAKDKGASFVLWRCVYQVTWCTPSQLALTVNSSTLARVASISQMAGLVPVLSVELLPDGNYSLDLAKGALTDILTSLMAALNDHHVYLEGLIIRLTPAFPGAECSYKCDVTHVVDSTLQACNQCIPSAVGGLTVARRDTLASSIEVLNELNKYPMKKLLPISFCFSRVIHHDVMKMWAGQDANLEKARQALVQRAKKCSLGSMGQHPEANGSLFVSKVISDTKIESCVIFT